MDDTFCTRLAAALAERNISRNELVKRGYEGLSYRKVHAYCTGESSPPMEFLTMLGQMGFDLPHLILGTPAPGAGQTATPDFMLQLGNALRATQHALTQITPLAAHAQQQAMAQTLASGVAMQLSPAEQSIIAHLRSQPEKLELVLAMLAPCPRCGSQDHKVA